MSFERIRSRKLRLALVFSFLVVVVCALSYFFYAAPKIFGAATTCYWVGDTNPANFNDASHWAGSSGGTGGTCDGGVVPGSDDTIIFDSANTNSVNLDVNVNVAGWTISSGYIPAPSLKTATP